MSSFVPGGVGIAIMDAPPISILFVCMGNICRSPLAEAVFRHKTEERDVAGRFELDSAGTGGWHAGAPPDPRAQAVAMQFGVVVSGAARRVTLLDFERFDHLICMDDDNRQTLLELGAPPEKVSLLLDADPVSAMREVPDPFYGRSDGFEVVYRLIDSACEALLDRLSGARS